MKFGAESKSNVEKTIKCLYGIHCAQLIKQQARIVAPELFVADSANILKSVRFIASSEQDWANTPMHKCRPMENRI